MHAAGIDFDSAFGDERLRETQRAHKPGRLVVGAVQVEQAKDFIADQVQASLLAKLHELQQRAAGIASRQGIVGIAQQHGFDADPLVGKVVGGLQRGEEVVVPVGVSGRLCNNQIDVGSSLEDCCEARCEDVLVSCAWELGLGVCDA